MAKILCLVLGYDKCLWKNESRLIGLEESDPLYIIQNNKRFFNQIILQIREDRFEKVILINGSMRQSDFDERKNSDRVSAPDFAVIQSYLQRHFMIQGVATVQVVLDPFRVADLAYNENVKPGTSYERTLYQNLDLENTGILHYLGLKEISKSVFYYASMHRTAALSEPCDEITFRIYDHEDVDLSALGNNFGIHWRQELYRVSPLIPENMLVELFVYNGHPSFDPKYLSTLKGVGEVNDSYFAGLMFYHAARAEKVDDYQFPEIFNVIFDDIKSVNKSVAIDHRSDNFREALKLPVMGPGIVERVAERIAALQDLEKKQGAIKKFEGLDQYTTAAILVNKNLLSPDYDEMRSIPIGFKNYVFKGIDERIPELTNSKLKVFFRSGEQKVGALNQLMEQLENVRDDEVREFIKSWLATRAFPKNKKGEELLSGRAVLKAPRLRVPSFFLSRKRAATIALFDEILNGKEEVDGLESIMPQRN